MIEPDNAVLDRMLGRLFGSMVSGPAMNARPYNSRQRLDWSGFSRFKDAEPAVMLRAVLGDDARAQFVARVPPPAKLVSTWSREVDEEADAELSAEERAAALAFREQQSLLNKLKVITDDARTYEQDTGVHALNIGYPLLHLPPGSFSGRSGASTRTILAPVAFVPVSLIVKAGPRQVIEIAGRGDGVDRVIPNIALLSWLEQQSGKSFEDAFADEAGEDPWREIRELVRRVAEAVEADGAAIFAPEKLPDPLPLEMLVRDETAAPRKRIVPAAVIGLFPTSNQGLLRDTREMVASGAPDGPIESFVRHGVSLEVKPPADATTAPEAPPTPPATFIQRAFAHERLVTVADPCQMRAVRLAQHARGLVVHGPPGTGKSQTITNIIGDHLARGERVLFVCDKRTALDVVAERLNTLGLSQFCAVVHDPQRDQRELYRSVREQLDGLADVTLKSEPTQRLAKVDAELQLLHDELLGHHRTLMGSRGERGSFHDLVGRWLSENGAVAAQLDEKSLQAIALATFDAEQPRLKDVLDRGETVGYATNPWRAAAAIELPAFLATPMDRYRAIIDEVVEVAQRADRTADPHLPPFGPGDDVTRVAALAADVAATVPQLVAIPADAVTHWSAQPATALATARTALADVATDVERVTAAPLDAGLLASFDPAQRQGDDVTLLKAYVADYRDKLRRYRRAAAAAGDVPADQYQRWVTADPKAVVAAKRKLDGAQALAAAVEDSTLDPSLLARFEAAPQEPARVIESLAALNAYLETAGKWYAFLLGARKRAADAAVRPFGLSASPASAASVRDFLGKLQQRTELRATLESATGERHATLPDDAELVARFRGALAITTALAAPDDVSTPSDLEADAATLAVVDALISPDVRERAAAVLTRLRMQVHPRAASEALSFLEGYDARQRVARVLASQQLVSSRATLPPDRELAALFRAQLSYLDLAARLADHPGLQGSLTNALVDPAARPAIVAALGGAPARAAAILELDAKLNGAGLFRPEWLSAAAEASRAGEAMGPVLVDLKTRLDTLEGVLRIREGQAKLPDALRAAAAELLEQSATARDGLSVVRRNVLAGEITRRLEANPQLHEVDGHRMQAMFTRFRELGERKRALVLEAIEHTWLTRQKGRLLAGTGNRKNKLGADLTMRLKSRGEKAMRLRQVLAHGAKDEAGDPLFELRPVWMASPETVAQIFPREAIFDVIIFDEASQCRLEEALPVLLRGKRVVIAGDPRQLPPTRFFESAIVTSEGEDAETDQELFEAHQGDVEDLLTAALGIEIEESYLDVHYRSRNSDLIGFSNEHFYGSRLQAIPGHPKNRSRFAPITLYRVDGVYDKRRNQKEAEQVVKIVQDLLKRSKPPSIGIACFNMVQRDLIVGQLESLADEDADFAERLGEARERRGTNSFEGLFVKNLENVQGDERDHIIISTTYGPAADGKFRRSFGPVGSAGGGRRLNVLVTRARHEIHLVTSIPKSAYAALPPVPAGAQAGGAWLLFAYLAYAEQLRGEYELLHRVQESPTSAAPPTVEARPTRSPSPVARALAGQLLQHHSQGSVVHWGNEGFMIDIALADPRDPDDVTVGVLCDMTRYAGSDDPVEWELFRTSIHEAQGWHLHRLWTPHLFRDLKGSMAAVVAASEAAVKKRVDADRK